MALLSSARIATADTTNIVVAGTNSLVVPLNIEGLPNAFKINDSLYRGAQPTADGFKELRKLGIKTVVCLRSFHSDKEMVTGTGLAYEEIPINTWDMETDFVVKFLKIATDTNRLPVFFHCQHGADRTGTMCAMYRIAVCGWSKDEAIKEMIEGGFGFHSTWQNLIKFIRNADIADIKEKAGLEKQAGASRLHATNSNGGN
jgi:protein tyrosine/serine phosphatase